MRRTSGSRARDVCADLALGVMGVLVLAAGGLAHAQTPPAAAEVSRYTGFFAAAARGDAAQIAALAAAGAAPDVRDGHGRTPLHVAAHGRPREAMRALVAVGANPNALDADRYDIVTIAAVAGDLPTVEVRPSRLGASPKTSRAGTTAPPSSPPRPRPRRGRRAPIVAVRAAGPRQQSRLDCPHRVDRPRRCARARSPRCARSSRRRRRRPSDRPAARRSPSRGRARRDGEAPRRGRSPTPDRKLPHASARTTGQHLRKDRIASMARAASRSRRVVSRPGTPCEEDDPVLHGARSSSMARLTRRREGGEQPLVRQGGSGLVGVERLDADVIGARRPVLLDARRMPPRRPTRSSRRPGDPAAAGEVRRGEAEPEQVIAVVRHFEIAAEPGAADAPRARPGSASARTVCSGHSSCPGPGCCAPPAYAPA